MPAGDADTRTEYFDLEVGLYRQDADTCAVELRFRQPDDQADPTPVRGTAQFDLRGLLARRLDPSGYGLLLSQSLFADQEVLGTFKEACRATEASDGTLRLRLYVDRSVPELHNLYWETLRDPRAGTWPDAAPWLVTNQRVLLSRYGRSRDWRPVHLRPKGDLRALVFVANPSDVANETPGGRSLAPVDVPGELQRAREALQPIKPDEMASDPQKPGCASLNALLAAVDREYDVVYLVCHGALMRRDPQGKPEPYLWLENADGTSHRVPGIDLVDRLRDALHRPGLVVLASCQSAGDGGKFQASDEGALAALGPRLVDEAGIPAVLAMQGSVTMETAGQFMPAFFQGLAAHGQIDQAVARARGVVRDRPDAWMPVLFMRLRLGQIWYEPRFAGEQSEFATWQDLLAAITSGKCTPILGMGLTEYLAGSRQEIAARWAEAQRFPLALDRRRDLAQVAQYLATIQSPAFPASELIRYVKGEVRRRHPDALAGEREDAPLGRLVSVVGAQRRQADEADPHRVLARLPAKIYVTATPDRLLEEALVEAGKDPQVALCPWNDLVEQPDSAYQQNPNFVPSVEQPLVYHLFGWLDQPESLVITDDDYYDYLIWASKEQIRGQESKVPPAVSRAYSANALLFLGFDIDDRYFRVLLHSVANPEAGINRRRPNSVAVQVNPAEGSFQQPERAQEYLETYLRDFRNVKTNMYWGTAQDFVRELWSRRQAWS